MKKKYHIIMKSIIKQVTGLLLLIISLTQNACIYQDETTCPIEVQFVYDYNMNFADGFPTLVNDVTLFIFDNEGNYLGAKKDQGSHLDQNYRMTLDLKPGVYRLVAWAGLEEDKTCYTVNDALVRDNSNLYDLTLSLNTNGDSYNKSLSNLWHGIVEDYIVNPNTPTLATIPLVYNVNRFKVLLQSATANELTKDTYSFCIEANNYKYNYDNSLQQCQPLRYEPSSLKEAVIENDAMTRNNNFHAVLGELSTLRLKESKQSKFIVRNENTGNEIFNIDLVKYLDLMRLDQHASMPLNEYLDRQNSYQVILLIGTDSAGNEMMLSLQINKWIMVFNSNDL